MLPIYLAVQGKQVHIPYYLWKMATFTVNLQKTPYLQEVIQNNTVPSDVQLPKKVNKVNFVINGHVSNYSNLCHELIDLGYPCDQTNIDTVIAYLTNRYLDIGLQPVESMLMTLSRLTGTFSITMLFSGETDLLMVSNRNSTVYIRQGKMQIHISEGTDDPACFSISAQEHFLLAAPRLEIQPEEM